MPFFRKFKSLVPFGVIGISVLVTIKLLTTQASFNEKELKVNAEEDISLVNFQDEIVMPPPPEEEAIKEDKEEEKEMEEATEETAQEESEGGDEDSEKEQEEEKTKKEEKPKQRKFIQGNKFSQMLSKLLSKDKKK